MNADRPLRVLFLAAESKPFASTGGLADVVGSLPPYLRSLNVDARVMMPRYGFIRDLEAEFGIHSLFSFDLHRPTGTSGVNVRACTYRGVPYYFLASWPWFADEADIYQGWGQDIPRFIFFCQAVQRALIQMMQGSAGEPWFPDVIHLHDWHTSLMAFFLAERSGDPVWRRCASVLTIHNIAYQGDYAGGWLWQLGIPGRHHPDLVYQNLGDNLLAIGTAYANKLNTVSPNFAFELQWEEFGYGLQGMIRVRHEDFRGILNGMDMERWNPADDPALAVNFDENSFEEKRPIVKRDLQRFMGLPERDDALLVGLVTRLVEQKGLDILIPAMRRFLDAHPDAQFVALGSGEDSYEAGLEALIDDRSKVWIGYHGDLARKIFGGSDLLLVPSRFEPCGLTQMYAMRYGGLPLVRKTGGLADTVENYDGGPADLGTGFVFDWYTTDALYGTLEWAYRTWQDRRPAWRRMQARAMAKRFTWEASAQQYLELYRQALLQRRGG